MTRSPSAEPEEPVGEKDVREVEAVLLNSKLRSRTYPIVLQLVKSLEEDKEVLAKQIAMSGMEESLKSLQKEGKELREALEAQRNIANSSLAECQKAYAEVEDYAMSAQTAKEEMSKLKEEVERVQNLNAHLQTQLQSKNSSEGTLKQHIEEEESKNRSLSQRVHSLEEENHALHERLQDQSELEALKTRTEKYVSDYQSLLEDFEKISEKSSELTTSLEDTKSQLREATRTAECVPDLEDEVSKLRTEISWYKSELEKSEQKLTELRTEQSNRTSEEIAQLTEQLQRVNRDNDRLKSEKMETSSKVDQLEQSGAQLSDLRRQLETSMSNQTVMTSVIDKLTADNAKLRDTETELRSTISDLRSKVAILEATVNKHQRVGEEGGVIVNLALEEENEMLKKVISQIKKESSERLRVQSEDVMRLQQEVNRLSEVRAPSVALPDKRQHQHQHQPHEARAKQEAERVSEGDHGGVDRSAYRNERQQTAQQRQQDSRPNPSKHNAPPPTRGQTAPAAAKRPSSTSNRPYASNGDVMAEVPASNRPHQQNKSSASSGARQSGVSKRRDSYNRPAQPQSASADRKNTPSEAPSRSQYHYKPTYPNDDLDVDVCKILNSIDCPVQIDITPIGNRRYLADQVIHIYRSFEGTLMAEPEIGDVVPLVRYLEELYQPFMDLQKHNIARQRVADGDTSPSTPSSEQPNDSPREQQLQQHQQSYDDRTYHNGYVNDVDSDAHSNHHHHQQQQQQQPQHHQRRTSQDVLRMVGAEVDEGDGSHRSNHDGHSHRGGISGSNTQARGGKEVGSDNRSMNKPSNYQSSSRHSRPPQQPVMMNGMSAGSDQNPPTPPRNKEFSRERNESFGSSSRSRGPTAKVQTMRMKRQSSVSTTDSFNHPLPRNPNGGVDTDAVHRHKGVPPAQASKLWTSMLRSESPSSSRSQSRSLSPPPMQERQHRRDGDSRRSQDDADMNDKQSWSNPTFKGRKDEEHVKALKRVALRKQFDEMRRRRVKQMSTGRR